MNKKETNETFEMNNVDQVVPKIRMILDSMPKNERKIVNELLAAGIEVKEINIYKLSKKHDVSPAYIVKLSRKCGFSGFREFKKALYSYHLSTNIEQQELLNPDDDANKVVEKIFKTAINNLQETITVFDYQALSEASTLLQNAKNIFFIGVGGSGALAMDAHHKFLRIGKNANWSNDPYLMMMNILIMEEDDILVAFSHSGKSKAVVDCVEFAKKRNIKTITITNSPKSPICDHSDYVLCSVAYSFPITGEGVAARIVQLCILDALFIMVAQKSYPESMGNINSIYESLKQTKFRN